MGVGLSAETAEEKARKLGESLNVTVGGNTGLGTGAQQQTQRLAQQTGVTIPSYSTTEPWTAWRITQAQAGLEVLWNRNAITTTLTPRVPLDVDFELPPRYQQTTGVETKTLLGGLEYFATLDPQRMQAVQSALYNHGYIKNRKWQNFGYPDETSVRAWQKAMEQAVRSRKTVWEVLGGKREDDLFNNGPTAYADAAARIGAASAPRRAPFQAQVANPEDLKAVARGAAQNTIGFVPDDAFLNNFVKLYQGMQTGAQRRAYSGSGTIVSAPDPTVAAQEQLRKKFATQATGQSVAKTFDAMLKIMGAGD